MENESSIDAAKVVDDLMWLVAESDLRCLSECSKWTNETLCNLPSTHIDAYVNSEYCKQRMAASVILRPMSRQILERKNTINFARTLIADKEYRRAKFFLEKLSRDSPVDNFLYYFSWYMISVQNRAEEETNDSEKKTEFVDATLMELRRDIDALKRSSPTSFDCFMNYLLGLIWKDSDAPEEASKAFREAVDQDNRCWPAWEGLSKLVDVFYSVNIEKEECGKTWQCMLFVAETMFRLQLYLCAIEAYTTVATSALGSSPYIICQIAAAQSDLQEHDSSMSSFQRVRRMDPYRIAQMNFFSDSLYIRQNVIELANLAKWFFESHKFYWETCCIVANYYSARKTHELAQDFLKRATKLCPSNASTWVLLGHEYMETKNHQAAVSAYRKATVLDPVCCYRGWYGLGQLYEILKLPENALYYYQQAHRCRPTDSRMLIALGVIFCKLDRKSDAEKCFKKAFQVGDVEGNALIHLGKLYEDQNDYANAAKAFEAYLTLYTEELVGDLDLIATACQFLAKHYLDSSNLDTAYTYAQRCLTFDMSKEEGFRILRAIMNKRQKQSEHDAIAGKSRATPSTLRNLQNEMMVTPVDAIRPMGGADESAIDTPTATSKKAPTEVKKESPPSDDDMNISDDADDDELSF